MIGEDRNGLIDTEVEDLRDVFPLMADFERFLLIPCGAADVAWNLHIGQELESDLQNAFALTGFAPAALDVEAETIRPIAPFKRQSGAGKDFTDTLEDSHVGGRV